MNALQGTTNNQQLPETEPLYFNEELLRSFIDYIGRGEKTTTTYLTNLKQFFKWLSINDIRQPKRADVKAYQSYLMETGHKANTTAGYMRNVKQLFKWTEANGLYPNIADNIHPPKVNSLEHKRDALTRAEVIAIENSIDRQAGRKETEAGTETKDTAGRVQRATEQGKRLKAIYLLAVNAGLRTVEISRANVGDLELKSGQPYIYVWGKGHSEADQKKAIAPAIYDAIQDYLNSRADKVTASSPLFVSTGNRNKGQRIAARTISTMLKRAMQEAGFNSERITAHSLRHTAGTAVQEITGDIFQTQNYMRHTDPKTTEIYLHNDKLEQDAKTATDLYNYYHGNEKDRAEELRESLQSLTTAQIEQLQQIAAEMAR